MYRVHLTNFGWFRAEFKASLEQALAYAREGGFEAGIYRGDRLVATWSPIGGSVILPTEEFA